MTFGIYGLICNFDPTVPNAFSNLLDEKQMRKCLICNNLHPVLLNDDLSKQLRVFSIVSVTSKKALF